MNRIELLRKLAHLPHDQQRTVTSQLVDIDRELREEQAASTNADDKENPR